MSEITVSGLGKMSAVLPRLYSSQAGHGLTVWNRSPAKIQPVMDDGVAAAVAVFTASPAILVCIDITAI